MLCPNRAFTLIELLVVITIIVALLSLLTPALDKAIYQAELAVCAANVKGIGSGATLYAMSNKRHYPYRKLNNPIKPTPHTLASPTQDKEIDMRPVLEGYFSINDILNDPMVQPIEMLLTEPDTVVFTSYEMYFSWQFGANGDYGAGAGMMKLGDRWSWDRKRFTVIATDVDKVFQDGSDSDHAESSHPDKIGSMSEVIWDNELNTTTPAGIGAASPVKFSSSSWATSNASSDRGVIDKNVGFSDASVSRFTDVEEGSLTDDRSDANYDPRMTRVPINSGSEGFDSRWRHVPSQ